MTDRALPYMPQLDGLRAVAVTAVLLAHFWSQIFVDTIPTGHYGVVLFFVLSGYLITGILLRCRALREEGQGLGSLLGRFYGRRALRLIPPLWLAIAVYAWLMPSFRVDAPWHFLYASNALFALREGWDPTAGHLWTLAIEEQFYVVWPLVILLAPRRWLVPATVVLLAAAPLWRHYVALTGWSFYRTHAPLWGNTDALCLGALCAILAYRGGRRAVERIAIGGFAVGLPAVVLAWTHGWGTSYFPALNPLAFAILSVGIVCGGAIGFGGPVGRFLSAPGVVGLGKISYGVYVYHQFVRVGYHWVQWRVPMLPMIYAPDGSYSAEALSWTAVGYFLVASTLSIGVAGLSWRYVEQPALALKRYLPYRRAAQLPAVAQPSVG